MKTIAYDEPVEIVVQGKKVLELHSDRTLLFCQDRDGLTKIFCEIRGGQMFISGPNGMAASRSGSWGDIVLANHHASLRAFTRDGLGTIPIVKLTADETPIFGRTSMLLPPNTAKAIGSPEGLMVVGEEVNRRCGIVHLYRDQVSILSDPDHILSTQDGEGEKLVIWFDPNQRHPNNNIVVGGYQIQNRFGVGMYVCWSALAIY